MQHGLSAGRVQSVATRIIVEREEEIRAFVPVEYWTVGATVSDGKVSFPVRFWGNAEGKVELHCEEDARRVTDAVGGCALYRKKRKARNEDQNSRAALYHIHAPAGSVAQARLPGVAHDENGAGALRGNKPRRGELGGAQGLITYMRTDSQRVCAEEAQTAA